MSRMKGTLAVILVLIAASAHADESALGKRLVAEDGWSAYRVAMVASGGAPCCYSAGVDDVRQTTCDLDARNGNFVSNRSDSNPSAELSIYWHTRSGKLDEVKAFAANCSVTGSHEIRWIDPVDAKESVAATLKWIEGAGTRLDSLAMAALALQAETSATTALISLAAPENSTAMRKDAIFWLGQARGVEGANVVEKIARNDSVVEMREHAVFSLTLSDAKDAYERIRSISRKDGSSEVRSKALFWMAQMQDPRASVDIDAALASETSGDVREQAVFALSQLGDGKAAAALIAVVRGNHSKAVKAKALFWLGQSGSDEALAFLDELLTKQIEVQGRPASLE